VVSKNAPKSAVSNVVYKNTRKSAVLQHISGRPFLPTLHYHTISDCDQGTSNGQIGQRFSALENKKTALCSAKSAKIACCAHRGLQKTALKAQRGSKSQRSKAQKRAL
jgi:hypothetical protein